MTVHEHRLSGCRPEPLATYLKALGVLRLVAEQVDAHATGHWSADGFVLATTLSPENLSRLFLEDYRPTPIVSPWNSSSGFGPEGKGELQDIESSTDPRLGPYREAIAVCRQLLRRAEAEGWVKDKQRMVTECRSTLPEGCLGWIDAAVVLTAGGPAYPPLLGTGGNVGRFEVSRNFHNRVLEALGLHSKKGWDRAGWLADALYGQGQSSLRRGESPSQFDPGAAGGANSSPDAPDGRAEAVLNPWDYVLLVEGSALFAAGAARRLAVGAGGRAAAPFMADSAAEGYPSAAEEEPAKGELWAPLWDRPTTYWELARLLAEGRADWRGRHARSGLDMAKAAAALGVDRGIGAFSRHVFLERAGQATVAVPAGRVTVQNRPAVGPLADLDPWLERVRRGSNPPGSVEAALRAVRRAAFEVAATGGSAPLWRVLIEAAGLERAVGQATSFRERAGVVPLKGLRASRWVPALVDDSTTTEQRLALSLASARDVDDTGWRPSASLRSLLCPIGYDSNGQPEWTGATTVEGLGHRPITVVLADTHARRAVDILATNTKSGQQRLAIGAPTRFDTGLWADQADVAALASARIDETLLGELLAGCLVLDWDRVEVRLGSADRVTAALPGLAILGPFYTPQPTMHAAPGGSWDEILRSTRLAPEPTWPALLVADRVKPVVTAALRRLRIAGLQPVLAEGDHLAAAGLPAGSGPRLAAALLCPLSPGARLSWLRQVCPDPDLSPKESADAQA